MGNKSSSKNLNNARRTKNDEFYTQLTDIEGELKHYKEQFKDKVVFCNCDDPYESNFFKCFSMNFNKWGLKKLIATCYAGSPIVSEQLSLLDVRSLKGKITDPKLPHKIEITEVTDVNKDGAIDLSDIEYLLKNKKNTISLLKGDGDFRSSECIKLLEQADIVVTNPPFSLFREFVDQLVRYNKQFLIIGSDNAITYKDIFKLIKENRIWSGYGKVKEFLKPDGSTQKFGNIGWFTNLKHNKRYEGIDLCMPYKGSEQDYPKYDNYDAIEVSKTKNIPKDYYGVMGVPISFLDKYNPNQFEILGIANSARWIDYECFTIISGKRVYNRLMVIRKLQES